MCIFFLTNSHNSYVISYMPVWTLNVLYFVFIVVYLHHLWAIKCLFALCQEVFVCFYATAKSWKMEDPNRPQRKMSTAGDSLYKVLGLEKGASPEEIKKAYRCVLTEEVICTFSIEHRWQCAGCQHFPINWQHIYNSTSGQRCLHARGGAQKKETKQNKVVT